jgi:hypothetical protein
VTKPVMMAAADKRNDLPMTLFREKDFAILRRKRSRNGDTAVRGK